MDFPAEHTGLIPAESGLIPQRAMKKLQVAQQQQHFLYLVQEDDSIFVFKKSKVMLAE